MIKFIKSFSYALKGIHTVWLEEQNFRIQSVIAAIVIAAMFLLRFSYTEFLFILVAIAAVLSAEIANTVLEDLCDKMQPNIDPAIKKIKDMSAAFVMIVSVGAVAIGIFTFLRHFNLDNIVSNPVVAWDTIVKNLIQTWQTPWLAKVFAFITLFGEWQTIVALAIFSSIILWLFKYKVYILPFLLTLAGAEFFVFAGKFAIHRIRPSKFASLLFNENSFSFPSGHAAISIAFYGFLAYFFFKILQRQSAKKIAITTALIFILLIGFSRLYLNLHFLSDVIGGYIVGSLWLFIGITISEWQQLKHRES